MLQKLNVQLDAPLTVLSCSSRQFGCDRALSALYWNCFKGMITLTTVRIWVLKAFITKIEIGGARRAMMANARKYFPVASRALLNELGGTSVM
jgi:hypothetical protein